MQYNIHYWVLQTIAMTITALLIPRFRIDGPIGAFVMVVSLAFVNAHIWDAALFFSLPNSATTQAIVLFLANGAIFWILVKLLPGIEIDGILPALVAPIVFTVCSMAISVYATPANITFVTDSVTGIFHSVKGFVTSQ